MLVDTNVAFNAIMMADTEDFMLLKDPLMLLEVERGSGDITP